MLSAGYTGISTTLTDVTIPYSAQGQIDLQPVFVNGDPFPCPIDHVGKEKRFGIKLSNYTVALGVLERR